jgi:hypothetical protein
MDISLRGNEHAAFARVDTGADSSRDRGGSRSLARLIELVPIPGELGSELARRFATGVDPEEQPARRIDAAKIDVIAAPGKDLETRRHRPARDVERSGGILSPRGRSAQSSSQQRDQNAILHWLS